MHVNLLPPTFLRRLAFRRQVARWGTVIAVTLLISGGFVAIQYSALTKARHAQTISAFRSQELHQVKSETERLAAEGIAIEASIATLEKARPEDRTLVLLGIASSSAKQFEGKVHLKNLTTQIAAATSPVHAPPPAPGTKAAAVTTSVQIPSDFLLEGTAEEAAAISGFIEKLRETGVFTRVDLTATNEAAGSSAAARHFRVDCKF